MQCRGSRTDASWCYCRKMELKQRWIQLQQRFNTILKHTVINTLEGLNESDSAARLIRCFCVYERIMRKTKTVVEIKKVSSWQLHQQLQRFFSSKPHGTELKAPKGRWDHTLKIPSCLPPWQSLILAAVISHPWGLC